MVQPYQKGDAVEVWSNSKASWISGGTILEAPAEDCLIEGYAIPAGAVKVAFSAGMKWIMPEDVPRHVRPSPSGRSGAVTGTSAASAASPGSPGVSTSGICKYGCGRPVQPGLTRGLKPFDTCCKKCALSSGGGDHDANCGGHTPAGGDLGAGEEPAVGATKTLAPGVSVRQWLDSMLVNDGARLATRATTLFSTAAVGADRVKLEACWPVIEEGLMEPVGHKLSISEAERMELLRSAAGAKRRWSFSGSGSGSAPESLDVDAPAFREICRALLERRRKSWFPEKLPTKSQYFVRKNPLRIEDVYDFGEQLGEGSFGVVHSVTHKVSGEQRVCKRIAKLKGKEGMKVEEILQEISSMAMLDHPNVIKVYEYFEDTTSISQIMEPCRGGELQNKIDDVFRNKKEPMYSEVFMCDIIKQTLRALAFIHGERFLHKDLKPQNIMLVDKAPVGADTATIKVIDFGLAELFSKEQKVSGQFGGTLLYMAPEVLQYQLTMKSDIWSVGIILYNLITGDYPFMATWPLPPGKDMDWWQSEVSRIIQDKKTAYKPHKRLSDGTVSAECIDFMGTVLNKDPKERPNAEQCLEHAWFRKFDKKLPPLSIGVTQCLEAYSVMPELKKALFLLIAHQSTAPALQELRAIFTHFDVKNRGALSEGALFEVLQKSGMNPIKAERVVFALDRDASGLISWTEFIAAALCISVCHNERLIGAAFHVFDTDQDNRVFEKDLLAVLARGTSQAVWKEKLPTECALLSDKPSKGFTRDHLSKYMGAYIATSAGDKLRAVG